MSRKVLLEAEHSRGTKSPNWRESDALAQVKGNSNFGGSASFSLQFSDFVPQLQKAHLTIFPRAPVEYEMIDSQRGAWRRVGSNDLIPNTLIVDVIRWD